MSDKEMPAVEAGSYELAFHVLPTIAEGEVDAVFQNLKDTLTKLGSTITTEEAPARIDLAYEIVKYLEGRNRKFSSAYFGWVRFDVDPTQVEEINQVMEADNQLLRHILIRLTKVESENPFYYHEALAEIKQVETIDVDEALATSDAKESAEADEEEKESTESPTEKEDSETIKEDKEEAKS